MQWTFDNIKHNITTIVHILRICTIVIFLLYIKDYENFECYKICKCVTLYIHCSKIKYTLI